MEMEMEDDFGDGKGNGDTGVPGRVMGMVFTAVCVCVS